jgi:hypothetical protein
MNSVLLHVLILWAVVAAVIAVLWLAGRARGGLQGLPYAGIFGFIGAAFGVVVGLTTFFASQHYAAVRSAAQSEATDMTTIVAMSGAFRPQDAAAMRRQLYCYATDVVDDEWPRMRAGKDGGSPEVEARIRAVYLELLRIGRPNAPQPTNWYSSAVDAGVHVAQDRQQRLLLGARPQIPNDLWVLIYVGSALMVVFSFFFHKEGRRQLVWMTVAVVVMLTAITGVLAGLDHPTLAPFGVQPDAMRREQARLGEALGIPAARASGLCARLPTPPATRF